VSVIVVTRDRPRFLADALSGVAAQVPPPLEVRVGDDGGGSAAAVVESLALLEVTLLPLSLGQAGAARNAAAAGARADVLAFLDDDDVWRPGHLEGLAQAFSDPAVGLAWRDCEIVRERLEDDGTRVTLESRTLARDWDDALMRSDDYLPPSAFAVRRSLFASLGGFDETLCYSEDWDLLLRAAGAAPVRRVPGVTGGGAAARAGRRRGARERVGVVRARARGVPAPVGGAPRLRHARAQDVLGGGTRVGRGGAVTGARAGDRGRGPRGHLGRAVGALTRAAAARARGGAGDPAGKLLHVYFEPRDLAGMPPGRRPRDRRRATRSSSAESGVVVRYGAAVASLAVSPRLLLKLADGEEIAPRAVLIATGARRRRLDVPGERELEDRGVSFSATRDRERLAGAPWRWWAAAMRPAENALLLAAAGCDVTLIARAALRARPAFRERVAAEPRVRVLVHTRVVRVLGETQVTGLELESPTGASRLACDGVVIKVGVVPNTEWCREPLAHDDEGYLRVDGALATGAPGVWAAGDVVRPAVLSAAVAVGQGVLAAAAIRRALR
jgi:thioredoxin reductase (NADPH)